MSLSLKEGWDRISDSYQKRAGIPTDDVYWGDFVATERKLGILGDVADKRILEIGCGGAQNSIALSKWGAKATGLDLSRRQLLHGRRLAKKERVEVNLVGGNMEVLPFIDGSFDVVTTAISLHYAPNLTAVVAEVNRVLADNGYFIFSTEHPMNEGKLTVRRGKPAVVIRDYFNRRIVRWIDKLPDGSKVRMHSYYRTLQDYFNVLYGNGFSVERYLELERLDEDSLHSSDRAKLRENRWARRFYKMMGEVPIWIIFKARKNASIKRRGRRGR